jgi:hypothetical protein
MSFLGTLFGGEAEKNAANQNRAQYGDYLTKGTGFLQTGLDNAMGAFGNAKSDYAPLSALAGKYGVGTDMRLNALGLNGAGGTAAAQSAFTAGPGYQWNVDQGLDALNRRRAMGGMLNSGNADIDAMKFGQGMASQEYNNWLSSLADIDKQNLSATGAVASGTAGIDQNRAATYTQNASDRTNLQGSYTSGMAGANTLEAQGKAAGAKNLLGAGMGLASLGTQLYGGMGGSFGGLAPGQVGGSINGSTSSIGYGGVKVPRFGF